MKKGPPREMVTAYLKISRIWGESKNWVAIHAMKVGHQTPAKILVTKLVVVL
jgi:hypothetical protein